MHFVDEQDHAAFSLLDFVEHRFQAFFELSAEFRTRDQCTHVERKQALALQAFGHVAVHDPQGQAFSNRGLADAGLTDQDRVVL